jgi:acetyltransferase-like isoleucine patch superfamily enzyme
MILSLIYKYFLRLKGMDIGKKVFIHYSVRFNIENNYSLVSIGDNTRIAKRVYIKSREYGRIVISENVYLDDDVRIVAARNGSVTIDDSSQIGKGSVINSGGRVSIGKYCLFAANCQINSSSHGMALGKLILTQSHIHGKIDIGDDCWVGANVAFVMNSEVRDGTVVGSNAVVTKSFSDPNLILAGVPAKLIGRRK